MNAVFHKNRILAGIAIVAIAVCSLALVLRYATNIPQHDDFGQQLGTAELFIKGNGPEVLFRLHNEHRLLTTFAVPATTLFLFGWIDMRASVLIGWFFLVGIFLLFNNMRPIRHLNAGSVIIGLLIFAPSGTNLVWAGGSLQYYAVIFFGLAAIYILKNPAPSAFLAACFLAFFSAFSMASGLLATVPATLYLLANQRKHPRWQPIVFTLFSIVLWTIYLNGFVRPSHHPSPTIAFSQPLFALRYYLLFSANFLTNLIPVKWILPASLVFHLTVAGFLFRKRRQMDYKNLEWYLLIFILLSCMAITAGRVGFLNLLQALSDRYQIYSVSLWSMALILLYRHHALPKWIEYVTLAMMFGVFAKSAIQQNHFLHVHQTKLEDGLVDYLSREDPSGLILDPQSLAAKFIDKGIAGGYYQPPQSVIDRISPKRTSQLFNPEPDPDLEGVQLVPPLSKDSLFIGQSGAPSGMRGYIDDITDLTAPAQAGIQSPMAVKGWMAANPQKGQLCDRPFIVLTNPKGDQLFYPAQPYDRPDLGNSFKQPRMIHAGFVSLLDVSTLNGPFITSMGCQIRDSLYMVPKIALPIRIHPDPQ